MPMSLPARDISLSGPAFHWWPQSAAQLGAQLEPEALRVYPPAGCTCGSPAPRTHLAPVSPGPVPPSRWRALPLLWRLLRPGVGVICKCGEGHAPSLSGCGRGRSRERALGVRALVWSSTRQLEQRLERAQPKQRMPTIASMRVLCQKHRLCPRLCLAAWRAMLRHRQVRRLQDSKSRASPS
jgi:hypothetical protein